MLTPSRVVPVILSVVAACSVRLEAPSHLSGESPLVESFRAAALEADVPADLLAGWAYLETRLVAHAADAHNDDEGHSHGLAAHGVMGLDDAQVDAAAALLKEPRERILSDDDTNIRAAAALLRAAADGTGRIEGRLTAMDSPSSWVVVAGTARGLAPDSVKDGWVRELARLIGEGARGVDARGLAVVLDGRGKVHVPARPVVVSALDPQDPYSAQYVQALRSTSGREGQAIDRIVIHTMQGSYAGTVSWFQNPQVQASAHYCVRSTDGEITQMVPLEDTAWHAGNWATNLRSIGIEHEGFVSDPGRWYTDAMYTKSAELVRWLADRYSIPLDRQHIIGHFEVPGCPNAGGGGASCHTDPGTGWDWDRFMALVQGSTPPPPMTTDRQLVGVVYDAQQGNSVRIAGATVTLLSGTTELQTTTSSSTGYWEFDVAEGSYTIRATATGYAEGTRTGSATATGLNWASIGLNPSGMTATGTFRGVIYSGEMLGEDPVEGATVTLGNGESVTTGPNGVYIFQIAPGDHTATARKDGYMDTSVTRTVTAGATSWGSMRLVANPVTPPMEAPPTPNPIAPTADITVDGTQVELTFSRVTDPQSAEVTYDVQLFRGLVSATPLYTLGAAQAATSPVRVLVPVSLEPAGYSWRVRARSSGGDSAWSATATFIVGDVVAGSSSSSGGAVSSSSAAEMSSSMPDGMGSSSSSASSSSSSSTGGYVAPPSSRAPSSSGKEDPDEGATVGGCAESAVPAQRGLPLAGLVLGLMLVAARRPRLRR